MDKVKILYDTFGRTLCVWVGDPQAEVVCEDIGDDTILMRDGRGRILGFERLNVELPDDGSGIAVELMPGSTPSR